MEVMEATRRSGGFSSVAGMVLCAGIVASIGTASSLAAAGSDTGKGPVTPTRVTRPALAGVSVPVSSIRLAQLTPDPNVVLEIPFRPPVRKSASPVFPSSPKAPDGALMARPNAPNVMPAPVANFQGVSQATQGAASGFFVSPPDTVGDVGPNHYVQCVNLGCQVFGKTGTPAGAVFTISAMFTSLGGDCATTNDGDPIVLYDPLADRWLISQFAVANRPPAHECVAISQTADPTGGYYLYDFAIPNDYFNDYPKLGVWPDGYYMTSPLFEGPIFGQGAYILNRTKMLAGDPGAEMVFFDLTTTFPGLQRILPADIDGPAPPLGTPNYMATTTADEFGDVQDGIRLFEVKANWQNLGASTFSEVSFPSGVLPVAAFDPTFTQVSGNCGVAFTGRDDIEQPAPANCGMRLDVLADRPMHRLAYRTRAGNESLVFNQTVDANATPATATSGHLAGIRYYELRRPLPSGSWTVNEQATFAPDSTHRWMGSAAMDGQGNIAVGYSVSDGTTTFPGVRYAGRLAGDPPNGLFQGEALMAAGGRSQTSTGSRWGDYSAMSVDPADDCTFWYTQEYYDPTAPPSCSTTTCWTTRVGSFMFPGCTVTSSTGTLTGTVTDSATAAAISGAIVSANGYTATSNGSGVYSMVVPAGTYTATASKAGYAEVSAAGLSVAAAGTTTQNFALGSGAIAGTVTDSVSAAAISGAQVAISGGILRTTSATGTYSASVAPATYTATASATGFFSSTQSGLVVGTSGTVTASFALQPAPGLTTSSTVDDTVQGNGNLIPDSNECAWLSITVNNVGSIPITTVSGVVTTSTAGVTVISGSSAYPDIAAAASGVNATAFRLQTSPSFVAGTPILVNLALTTNLGLIDLPVTVQSFGGTPSSFPATGPVAIPDNNAAGAALDIPVAGFTSTLAHVAVRVRITHTYDGDLVLKLAGPDGTTVLLAYQAGGAGAGFGTDCPASANDTTFDDTAAASILAGTAPFVGSFVPQQALVAFAGKSGAQVNGTWKVQALDLGAADVGNIECVELLLTGTTPGPGGTCLVPVELQSFEVE